MKMLLAILIFEGLVWISFAAEPLALYNFNNRLKAPCPYPKELAEKKKAASYVPNIEQGECGPPLLHKYSKYGSRSWYDPRDLGGVLHMKFSHAWLFDQFHTEKTLFSPGIDFSIELKVSVKYSYGKRSLICSIGGVRLWIEDYKHLTGQFFLVVDDGKNALKGGPFDSDIYHDITFGRITSEGIFLKINGKPCNTKTGKVKVKSEIPEELWIGGANDIKIGLIKVHKNKD